MAYRLACILAIAGVLAGAVSAADPAGAKGIPPWEWEVSSTSVEPGEALTVTLRFGEFPDPRIALDTFDLAEVNQLLELYPADELVAAIEEVRSLDESLAIPVTFGRVSNDVARAEVVIPTGGDWVLVPMPWDYAYGVVPHERYPNVPEPVEISVGGGGTLSSWILPALPALFGLPLAALMLRSRHSQYSPRQDPISERA